MHISYRINKDERTYGSDNYKHYGRQLVYKEADGHAEIAGDDPAVDIQIYNFPRLHIHKGAYGKQERYENGRNRDPVRPVLDKIPAEQDIDNE